MTVHQATAASIPASSTQTSDDPGGTQARGLFSRADVRAHGLTDDVLRWRLKTGAWVRLRHDTYITADRLAALRDNPALLHGLHAAAAVARTRCDTVVVSHRSAALLHGLPLLHRWPTQPEVTVPRRHRGTLRQVIEHTVRDGVPEDDVMVIDGLAVTSPLRTVIDVAMNTSRIEAVVVVDAALSRRLVSVAELERVARGTPDARTGRRIGALLALVDARSHDPLTSVARLTLLDHGVTLDQIGVVVARAGSESPTRIPLLWNHGHACVVPSNDHSMRSLVTAAGLTPIAIDLTTLTQRGSEFAAVIAGLIEPAPASRRAA